MTDAELIPEPSLFFRGSKAAKDAKTGLLAHGPFSGQDPQGTRYIRVGAVGTAAGIGRLRQFFGHLAGPIHPPDDAAENETPFPGASATGVLGFQFDLDRNAILELGPAFLAQLRKPLGRKERVLALTQEIVGQLRRFREEVHPMPDIVMIPIDDELIDLCVPKGMARPRIYYQSRAEGFKGDRPPMFDFRHYIKAQAAMLNIPTQILLPSTMGFARGTEPAHILAWNFAVGLYYKATGFPWKLADIDDQTCFIGITHYRDWDKEEPFLRTSVAQVYMRTGESQVVRGEPFAWDLNRQGRDVYLETPHMERLIRDAIQVYTKSRNDQTPSRVVVHKKGPFNDAELEGIAAAAPEATCIDAIHIQGNSSIRAYVQGHQYPVTRGTMIDWGDQATLYTTGYVSSENTYNGPATPRPLHVTPYRLDSSLRQVCEDILGLTKLDWNTASFCIQEPVTIAVSRKVGDVLAELPSAGPAPPGKYLYYM